MSFRVAPFARVEPEINYMHYSNHEGLGLYYL